MILLPLREKVSAKPTDEGSMKDAAAYGGGQVSATPHPTSFGGHLLPQGEKDSQMDARLAP